LEDLANEISFALGPLNWGTHKKYLVSIPLN